MHDCVKKENMKKEEREPEWVDMGDANKPIRNWLECKHDKRKIPKLPFMYMMKPSGNKVRLVVKTTRNLAEAQNHEAYTYSTINSRIRKGFIPWHYGDVAQYAPGVLTKNGLDTKEKFEAWRAEEQERRFAAHRAAAAEVERTWERSSHVASESAEAINKIVKAMSDQMTQQQGSVRRGRQLKTGEE